VGEWKMEFIDLLTQSRKVFFECIEICNSKYRHGDDLEFYRELIAQHREVADLNKLIASESFLPKLYATLEKWDMNRRRAKLVDVSTMFTSIRSHQEKLSSLYRYRLEELSEDDIEEVLEQLSELFCGLEIMATHRRIVGVSKALHFLLPDLVMPIDSSNTMLAFYGYNRYDNSAEKEFKTFTDIFLKSHKIAIRLELSKSDISSLHWSCSVPKLIDNAIFGFFIKINNSIKNEKK
jgi:hypothetical protein